MGASNTWETLLFLGRIGKLTGSHDPEDLFRQALEVSESTCGSDSPEAGLCLMELADWLENIGEQEEADRLTERYRSIICRVVREWKELE
jgi:hypothetical protein